MYYYTALWFVEGENGKAAHLNVQNKSSCFTYESFHKVTNAFGIPYNMMKFDSIYD